MDFDIVVNELSQRMHSHKVWYQKVSDSYYNVGYEDFIYYKIRGDNAVWKSLY